MTAESKRLTLVVPPEMEPTMERAKQLFYNRSNSEMIRLLITEGLDSMNQKAQDDSPALPPIESPK